MSAYDYETSLAVLYVSMEACNRTSAALSKEEIAAEVHVDVLSDI
jgi:hypothetical protein